jgi:hypothetical protein
VTNVFIEKFKKTGLIENYENHLKQLYQLGSLESKDNGIREDWECLSKISNLDEKYRRLLSLKINNQGSVKKERSNDTKICFGELLTNFLSILKIIIGVNVSRNTLEYVFNLKKSIDINDFREIYKIGTLGNKKIAPQKINKTGQVKQNEDCKFFFFFF